MSDIKKAIQQEFIKCASDPVYFMRNYCYVQHPTKGRILFNLYPFQEQTLNIFKGNKYKIINKSRQLGISTLAAGYSLWMMLFQKDKNILCIATKQETARNMVTKVSFMYENLPSWLSVDSLEKNKLSLRLKNGSQIKATSASSDAGRSEAVSFLIIDEAAFIDNIGEIWASAQQTLSTGGEALVLSTPYGVGNWFHKTWVGAQNKTNGFIPIKLPWYVHPERDQEWRDQQDRILGDPKIAAQECDCDFSSSGDTVFLPKWVSEISETIIDPIERRGVDKNLWIWRYVDYNKNYLITADVARGDGADYSAAQVIDIEENTQVAEYRGQLPTKEFGLFLCTLGAEYNNALIAPENSSVGWATVETIIDRGYSNLYYSSRSQQNYESYFYEDTSNKIPGFTTSLKTRPLLIDKFREYLADGSVRIHSKRLLEEMKTFIWKNGRPEAQSGYNDDLVMSFAISQYLRDTSLKYRQHNLDHTRASLGGIQATKGNSIPGAIFAKGSDNPYSMSINKNENINLKDWI